MEEQKEFVSLYSGPGGNAKAAIDLGFSCFRAFDKDPHVHQTWLKNSALGFINHEVQDLTEYTYPEATPIELMLVSPSCSTSSRINLTEYTYPEATPIELMLVSPSCSTSSKINVKAGEKPQDLRTAESIVRAIKAYQPRIIVMDTIDQYPTICKESWAILTDGLVGNGYLMDIWHLNAKHYGVPQDRKRMFLVAKRDSFLGWKIPKKDNVSQGWYKAIQDIVPKMKPFDLSEPRCDEIRRKIDLCENSPWYLCAHAGAQPSWRARGIYEVAPTIKALEISRGALNQLIVVNRENPLKGYRLPARAYARLQGLPDDLNIYGVGYVAGYQIGNAMPPPLMSAVLKAVSV